MVCKGVTGTLIFVCHCYAALLHLCMLFATFYSQRNVKVQWICEEEGRYEQEESTIWLEILPRKIYWEYEKNWESIRMWVFYHKGVGRHYVGTREIFLESQDLTIEGSENKCEIL